MTIAEKLQSIYDSMKLLFPVLPVALVTWVGKTCQGPNIEGGGGSSLVPKIVFNLLLLAIPFNSILLRNIMVFNKLFRLYFYFGKTKTNVLNFKP